MSGELRKTVAWMKLISLRMVTRDEPEIGSVADFRDCDCIVKLPGFIHSDP